MGFLSPATRKFQKGTQNFNISSHGSTLAYTIHNHNYSWFNECELIPNNNRRQNLFDT